MDGPTENTKVLLSFGAWTGGFEFAMQLRMDIFRKFGKHPESDPAFCYLDAESLRNDAKTSYTYQAATDKNMMANPYWDKYYEAAMRHCETMILFITKEWLVSKWCWRELDMLVRAAEKRPELNVIIVMFPDGAAKLRTSTWTERQEGGVARSPQQLAARLDRLPNATYIRVAESPAIVGAITRGYQNPRSQGSTIGSNTFAYACSAAECDAIIANVKV
jgi:hypothetical protein